MRSVSAPMDLPAVAGALSTWLGQRFPAAHGVEVLHLQAAAGGFSNLTLTAELRAAEGAPLPASGIAVRLQTPTACVFPDNDIAVQYGYLQCLAGSAVPVPRLLGLEPDPAVLGAPFFVMVRVEGQVPAEDPLYHQHGWLHALPPAAQRQHWLAGIELLAVISRVDWRACGLFSQASPAWPEGLSPLEQQLEQGLRHLRWVETLGRAHPWLHEVHRWLCQHRPPDTEPCLQWGDAKLGNCIFRQGRVVASLDWETAHLGCAAGDLAWWLVHDEALSAGYGVPRLPGFPGRAESVAHWERASGRPAQHLDYLELLANWRFAIIMARLGTLFMAHGWVPQASRMDIHNGAAAVLRERTRQHAIPQP
ncbi:MAG: phosphotransferase family protein [Rubrivivax sp.]|jgi:aminoglycoside phosphotransferase (APT) family kinase protein|nr:phosphotransferase family protein [Rubrivivax sp.]